MGQDLNLPGNDSLLAPIAALEAPSFAAAPAFQAPMPSGSGTISSTSELEPNVLLSWTAAGALLLLQAWLGTVLFRLAAVLLTCCCL